MGEAGTPRRIGRYLIQGVIGRGAMGIVYKAHDPDIDRELAVKLVRADLLEGADKDDVLARFRREAQAAARCVHPAIVAVYDFALHDGNPFIAMEFLPSTSLAQIVARQGALPAPRALHIMAQVLAGLGAAHRAGVIHRDIKPANILVADGDLAKVTDFGVARLDRSDMTQSGSMIGTLSYMSPEQCRGDPVDARSDLFSAAVVLYEALTGERAFAGRSESQIIQGLLGAEPPALADPARLGGALAAALRRALAKQADDRFPNAEAFAAALAATGQAPGAEDGTLVQPRAPAPAAGFDAAVLATVERRLAQYLGPIARHLVAGAAREADSLSALCTALAGRIGPAPERDRFLRETLGEAATTTGSRPAVTTAGAVVIDAAVLAAAQTALTRHIGPIAPVLIRKTLQLAVSRQAFWEEIAAQIGEAREREAFLRRFSN